jgi:hypothetical protein
MTDLDNYVLECKRLYEDKKLDNIEILNAIETISKSAIECDITPKELIEFVIIAYKLFEKEQHV